MSIFDKLKKVPIKVDDNIVKTNNAKEFDLNI